MKKAGKFLSAAIACIVAVSGLSFNAFAAEEQVQSSEAGSPALWADGNPNVASTDQQNSLDAIKWFSSTDIGKNMNDLGGSSNHYYLLMPTTADLNNLTLWHTFSSNPKINGVEIKSGETASVFGGTGDYEMTVDGSNYTLTVMQSQYIGSMYISTESGTMRNVHEDKENKESGNILVVEADGKQDYNGELSHIKGRGNTTWTNMEKKPYNIKLDKKASLLGMDTSKKWCLLANAQDHSMLRNKVAYDLADEVGLTFSPDSEYVDLYLNGEYSGVYQVSEKVEEGKNNLVKINDLTDQMEDLNDKELDSYQPTNPGTGRGTRKYYNIPNDPEDITGGYLLEWEVRSKYSDEPSGFVTKRGQYVVVKGPEYASKAQVEYISGFVQEMEDAIYSDNGYNSLGKHYSEYLDVESAALMYLIQEYSVNIDSGITSCFFYKDSDSKGDGKIHASPVWDFDVAFGNLENWKDGVSMRTVTQPFAAIAEQYENGQLTIFAQLCQHNDFNNTVKQLYNERFKPALEILNNSENISGEHIKSLPQYYSMLKPSSEMNYVRWKLTDSILVMDAGRTFDSQFSYFQKFLSKRAVFLNDYINGAKKPEGTEDDFVIYFANWLEWEDVYLYYWNGTNNVDWPGIAMKKLEGYGEYSELIYKLDLSALGEKDNGNIQIVINNGYGNGKQTDDIYARSHMEIVPYYEPYRTATDAEATKNYYKVEISEFYEEFLIRHDFKVGDVDFDGEVTSADALKVLRISVGLENITTGEMYWSASIDDDFGITSTDALYILRHCVGYQDNLPLPIGSEQHYYSYEDERNSYEDDDDDEDFWYWY